MGNKPSLKSGESGFVYGLACSKASAFLLCKERVMGSIPIRSTIDKGYLERLVTFCKKVMVVKKSSALMGYRFGQKIARSSISDVLD
jgi:hypothetical protein